MRTNNNQTNTAIHEQALEAPVNKHVITEGSVYPDLARCARANEKVSFDLLLAMATQDATQFDEFRQINTPNTFKDVLFNDVFQIQPKPMYGEGDSEKSLAMNKTIQSKHFKDVQLKLLMEQQPLVEGSSKVSKEVYYNLGYNEQILNEELNKALVDEVRTKDINSKKVNIHSIERPDGMDIAMWFNTISEARSLDLVS